MPEDTSPLELVDELHRCQGEMYAGGSFDAVIENRRVREVWLVPLDSELFDRIWSGETRR